MTFAEYVEQSVKSTCPDRECRHCRLRRAIVDAISATLPTREETIAAILAQPPGGTSPKVQEFFDTAVALIAIAFLVQGSITPDEPTALQTFGLAIQEAMERFGFESNVATGPGVATPGASRPKLVTH